MREMKFRAWDKRTRKMIHTGFHILGEVTCFDLIYDYCMEHGKRKDEVGLLRMNSVVLMEWSGLKDKNGEDVYEGDLVRTDGFVEGASLPVIYRDGMFLMGEGGVSPLYSNIRYLEIIGNIYENPELTKDE